MTTTSTSMPPNAMPDESDLRQVLSALADGEAAGADPDPASALNRALAAWGDGTAARQAWHSYQLIGDVLRSEDLARAPAADQDFLNRLRSRLEAEPVHRDPGAEPHAARPAFVPSSVPSPVPASARHLGRWQAGFAVAASVAVASVALLLLRSAGPVVPDEATPLLVRQQLPSADPNRPAPAWAVNSVGVLRDPRLDEFLRLHHMARGGLAVGAPGGSLQRADLQMSGGSER